MEQSVIMSEDDQSKIQGLIGEGFLTIEQGFTKFAGLFEETELNGRLIQVQIIVTGDRDDFIDHE